MCQIVSLDGDRLGNLLRVKNAIGEAKNARAEIICFPETVILGWVNPDARQRACRIPGRNSDRVCQLAADYESHLCVGLAEKEGTNLYDSAILVDDKGQILLKHRKINILKELMTPPYTPGREVNAVQTRFGIIGLLICADTHRDNILKRMATLKPDLLLVPCGYAAEEDKWPGHGKELEDVVAKAAKITDAPVVGTNLVGQITNGPWKGRTYGGYSVAADATGKIISLAKDRDRDIRIVSLKIGP